jgi:hypothetical protein
LESSNNSSTYLTPLGIFQQFIHIPPPLSFFHRVWNPLFFRVFHYCPFFVCALPMETICFNHLDEIRFPVKLVQLEQFSSVLFFSILHSLEVDCLFYVWHFSKTTPSYLVW